MNDDGLKAPLMSEEQQEAYDALTGAWKREKLLTVAIWGAVTVCLIAAVHVSGLLSDLKLWDTAALTLLPSILVLLIVMAVQDSRFRKRVRSTPEMNPQNTDPALLAFWRQCDKEYDELHHKLHTYQVLIIAGSLLLSNALVFLFPIGLVCALVVLPIAMDVNDKHLFTPYKILDKYAESGSKRIGCSTLLVFLACIGLSALSSMFGFTANSKRESLNGCAHDVYKAAAVWASDCDTMGLPVEPGIYTGCFTDEATDPDSLHAAIKRYYNVEKSDWYAVIIDSSGTITKTFYKKDMITESDLTPMAPEQQRELLSSPFSQKKAVGYYIPETQNTGVQDE